MSNHTCHYSSNDEVISLLDLWKKLVQSKKIFGCIFFVVFIIGGVVVLLTPPTYIFSQVIEIGCSPDVKGQNFSFINTNDAIMKIKKILYPAALHIYNSQAIKKKRFYNKNLIVESAGSNALLLSINGPLKYKEQYRVILQEVAKGFIDDTKEYIDYRKATLTAMKLSLEHRLTEMNTFYKEMIKKGINMNVEKQKDMVAL